MATDRTWVGGQHDYYDPASWVPNGAPTAGDTATIGLGTAAAPNVATVTANVLSGTTTVLDGGNGAADLAADPTLTLTAVIIGSDASIQAVGHLIPGSSQPGPISENLNVNGIALNNGNITVGNSGSGNFNKLNINLGNYTAFYNQSGGNIQVNDINALNISGNNGPAVFVNNGTVSGTGAGIVIGTQVWGNGTFDVTAGGNPGSRSPLQTQLEFKQAVQSGETIRLNDSLLILDSPMSFQATIDDMNVGPPQTNPYAFSHNSSILLPGTTITGESFQNDVLTVSNGNAVLAQLHFAPGLAAADFSFGPEYSPVNGAVVGSRIDIGLPAGAASSMQVAQPASLSMAPPQQAQV